MALFLRPAIYYMDEVTDTATLTYLPLNRNMRGHDGTVPSPFPKPNQHLEMSVQIGEKNTHRVSMRIGKNAFPLNRC
jgi:hypothetical protein